MQLVPSWTIKCKMKRHVGTVSCSDARSIDPRYIDRTTKFDPQRPLVANSRVTNFKKLILIFFWKIQCPVYVIKGPFENIELRTSKQEKLMSYAHKSEQSSTSGITTGECWPTRCHFISTIHRPFYWWKHSWLRYEHSRSSSDRYDDGDSLKPSRKQFPMMFALFSQPPEYEQN